MSRRAVKLTQAEIVRYVRAVRAGGLEIQKTVIGPDGSISLFHSVGTSDESAYVIWKGRKDADAA